MRRPLAPPRFVQWPVSDGYVLHGRSWPPAGGRCTHPILYLHGIQSHGAWFEWSASLLAETGRAVLLADRRGSGLNDVARGDTPSAQRCLDDLDEIADAAARDLAAEQFDVVGVSWGGKLATAWALRRPERVRRILLIAPGLFPAVDVGAAGRVRIGVSLLTRPTRMLSIPLNDPALFTDNPAGQTFIADDPLKLTAATARFFYESAKLDRMLVRAARGTLCAVATLVLAGHDRIIRNEPTLRWLERLAARPPSVHCLAESAHTLEFEPDVTALERVLSPWAAG